MIYVLSGGGGSGATLTVTAPPNVTVTATKDGKTKTKTSDSSGVAVFNGLATGTWQVTISDGTQTTTQPVNVSTEKNISKDFFYATINVGHPVGSTCTCHKLGELYDASEDSGEWLCVVPETGTWVISCTYNGETQTREVEITSNEQTAYVTFLFGAIYANGAVSVPMQKYESSSNTVTFNSDHIEVKSVKSTDSYQYAVFGPVGLSGIDTVSANFNNLSATSLNTKDCVYIAQNANTRFANAIASAILDNKIANNTVSLSVTAFDGEYYIYVGIETPNWANVRTSKILSVTMG